MKGELDWVRDEGAGEGPRRRYDTANGLARDIQRYLADEVVEARPPTPGTGCGSSCRRHKGQVIAASLVLLALVAGMVGTTWGLIRAEQAPAGRSPAAPLAEANEQKRTGAEADRRGGADASCCKTCSDRRNRPSRPTPCGKRRGWASARRPRTRHHQGVAGPDGGGVDAGSDRGRSSPGNCGGRRRCRHSEDGRCAYLGIGQFAKAVRIPHAVQ